FGWARAAALLVSAARACFGALPRAGAAFVAGTVVFSFGELVFSSAVPAAVARLAPPGRRGAYQGAWTLVSSVSMGSALFVSGLLRDATGWTGAWILYAAVAFVASVLLVLTRERFLRAGAWRLAAAVPLGTFRPLGPHPLHALEFLATFEAHFVELAALVLEGVLMVLRVRVVAMVLEVIVLVAHELAQLEPVRLGDLAPAHAARALREDAGERHLLARAVGHRAAVHRRLDLLRRRTRDSLLGERRLRERERDVHAAETHLVGLGRERCRRALRRGERHLLVVAQAVYQRLGVGLRAGEAREL